MGFRFSPSHINKSIKQERGMGDGSPARGLTAGGKVAVADVTGVLQRHKAPGSSRAPDTEHEQGNNQRRGPAGEGASSSSSCRCRCPAVGVVWCGRFMAVEAVAVEAVAGEQGWPICRVRAE